MVVVVVDVVTVGITAIHGGGGRHGDSGGEVSPPFSGAGDGWHHSSSSPSWHRHVVIVLA